MVDKYIHLINGVEVPFTEEEITARKSEEADANSDASKLKQIKQIRLEKLIETDWYSNSDVTMPDNIKTWRQSLRDIPSNHTDEDAYDLLLARDSDGKLTHSIWSKP
tara:strand:- start:8926 stop:9246 length:321 start_codon:yes stop_codon:yes gene_type:complete